MIHQRGCRASQFLLLNRGSLKNTLSNLNRYFSFTQIKSYISFSMIIFFLKLTRRVKSSILSSAVGSVLFLCSRTLLPFFAGAEKAACSLCPGTAAMCPQSYPSPCCRFVISCCSCNAAFKGYSQNLNFFLPVDTSNILKSSWWCAVFWLFVASLQVKVQTSLCRFQCNLPCSQTLITICKWGLGFRQKYPYVNPSLMQH